MTQMPKLSKIILVSDKEIILFYKKDSTIKSLGDYLKSLYAGEFNFHVFYSQCLWRPSMDQVHHWLGPQGD